MCTGVKPEVKHSNLGMIVVSDDDSETVEFGTDMFYQCGALSFRRAWTARTNAERALFDKHHVPYEVISYDDLIFQASEYVKDGLIAIVEVTGKDEWFERMKAIEEDIWRRDFTVNALYYNIADYSVWDYTGGMEDLRSRTLRLIDDPWVRYREDPVRMLRAARFAEVCPTRCAQAKYQV